MSNGKVPSLAPTVESLTTLFDTAEAYGRDMGAVQERLVVWLVGISSGSLALLVSRNLPLTHVEKAGVIVLVVSIAMGVGERLTSRVIAMRRGAVYTARRAILEGWRLAVAEQADTDDQSRARADLVRALANALQGGKPGKAETKIEEDETLIDRLMPLSSILLYLCTACFVAGGVLLIWGLIW